MRLDGKLVGLLTKEDKINKINILLAAIRNSTILHSGSVIFVVKVSRLKLSLVFTKLYYIQ